MKRGVSRFVWCEVCRGVGGVFGLSGWPAFWGVSMEVWSQCKPGLLSVFLDLEGGQEVEVQYILHTTVLLASTNSVSVGGWWARGPAGSERISLLSRFPKGNCNYRDEQHCSGLVNTSLFSPNLVIRQVLSPFFMSTSPKTLNSSL